MIGEILVLHLLGVRQDFVDRELFGSLPDQLMLLGEIFRSEDVVDLALFEQKAAARDFRAGNCRVVAIVAPKKPIPPRSLGDTEDTKTNVIVRYAR